MKKIAQPIAIRESLMYVVDVGGNGAAQSPRCNEQRSTKGREMKTFALAYLALVCVIALGWVLAANDLAMVAFFAPKQEQVRRNTFEKSKAYNDGMVQELRAMQFEYIKADDKHKPALASVIKHRSSGYPEASLPSDLSDFIRSLP